MSVDDQVGKLLDTLDRHNLRENTLIIFSSDNGANGSEGGRSAPYRGGKGRGTQQEGWVRVPTIFSWPGVIPENRKYDGLTCTLDYYATIATLAGHAAPRHLDGVNMLPYLTGKKTGTAHGFLFWLNNDPVDAPRRHLTAVRWRNWRLYHHKQHGWQLFDLQKDPEETQNVADRHPTVVQRMKSEHAAWAKTLTPQAELPRREMGQSPVIPTGYGWALAVE